MQRIESAVLKSHAVAHGFFGRAGGVSRGIYASLNCGPGSRDDPSRVEENRHRVCMALGQGVRLITLRQIHSNMVLTISPNAGQPFLDGQRPEGDGLVTDIPLLALGVLTADCAPILLADPTARVIGAAHAGWKGALAGIIEATIGAMQSKGADVKRIGAVIGPCISRSNYEVSEDFFEKFVSAEPRNRGFFTPSGRKRHYHFDLQGYGAHRLAQAGIASIEKLEICTYPPENGYFSFRRSTHAREDDYGRQISAIMLTDHAP